VPEPLLDLLDLFGVCLLASLGEQSHCIGGFAPRSP
jgi:hypothetical protein